MSRGMPMDDGYMSSSVHPDSLVEATFEKRCINDSVALKPLTPVAPLHYNQESKAGAWDPSSLAKGVNKHIAGQGFGTARVSPEAGRYLWKCHFQLRLFSNLIKEEVHVGSLTILEGASVISCFLYLPPPAGLTAAFHIALSYPSDTRPRQLKSTSSSKRRIDGDTTPRAGDRTSQGTA
ncbi:hypothetical protein EYF80_049387 [Liparis tanakae]|uniref:Uncharacterized protein n=1 Tax=Liparis tanakae TaxID=230148 RepID=A0A4Z2FHQ2_9TELE|nr:hypothetical protein EYF80_049387 [Liparis tanakae]